MAINWAALGTWAAVVTAICIALKDTYEKRKDKWARHVLVAASIFPDVVRLHDALEEANSDADLANKSVDFGLQARTSEKIAAVMMELQLEHIRGYADQADALPHRILIPLAKAINLMRMLNENAVIGRRLHVNDPDAELAWKLESFEEWHAQSRSVVNSLKHVVLGCEKLLKGSF